MPSLVGDVIGYLATYVDAAAAARAVSVSREFRDNFQQLARAFVERVRRVSRDPLTSWAQRLLLTEEIQLTLRSRWLHTDALLEPLEHRVARTRLVDAVSGWYTHFVAFLRARKRVVSHLSPRRLWRLDDHHNTTAERRLSMQLSDDGHYPGSPNVVVYAGDQIVAALCPDDKLYFTFENGRVIFTDMMHTLTLCFTGMQSCCQICFARVIGTGPCARCREPFGVELFATVIEQRALLRRRSDFRHTENEGHARVPLRVIGRKRKTF